MTRTRSRARPAPRPGHVRYACLRGRVMDFRPAPAGNPHMWILVRDDGGTDSFATVNVQSSKDAPGSPAAASFLYVLVDNDFRHPIVPSLLARPSGLHPAASSYADGALDFVKGNLFDPRRMRVLPTSDDAGGGDDLVHRLSALLAVARDAGHDLLVFGSAFQTSPGQTDAAFGTTPAQGIDNVHMAQGDPPGIEDRIHENAAWHDGALFVVDRAGGRITAVFLAFQTQSFQTDAAGQPLAATTGYEPPRFTFDGGIGDPIPAPAPPASLTSLHRLEDGVTTVTLTNMTPAPLATTGWSLLADATRSLALQVPPLAPGQSLPIPLGPGFVSDAGGILTLLDAEGARVDGTTYPGGPGTGWSTDFT